MVGERGLEPPRITPLDPKSCRLGDSLRYLMSEKLEKPQMLAFYFWRCDTVESIAIELR